MAKKRIAVVTSDVPFVQGGHIVICRSTVQALRDRGYEADLFTTPQNRFGRQFQAYLATRLTDFGVDGLNRPIHQVISFRFPSYAVKHPVHVCWLNHRMREYYDLWEALNSQLRWKGKIKERLRRFLIHRLDRYLLKHGVTKLYAQSETIRKRLLRWGNIPSEVLYPPPPQRNYRTETYGDFILAVSRLHRLKRLDLLIDALRFVKNKNIKATIIGSGPEAEDLARRVREGGLQSRVTFLGEADNDTLVRYYGSCLAVFFCPRNEDYGLVTAEAFASGKAVITASDSGVPAEIVRHGETGFVVAPSAVEIAGAIDRLAEDKKMAESLGQKALSFISRITWEDTVKKLVVID